MENKQQDNSVVSETALWFCFICWPAQEMQVVTQPACTSLCVHSPSIHPSLLPHSPNQINTFVNTVLELSQEYLKMSSHVASNYKEEIIQTTNAP